MTIVSHVTPGNDPNLDFPCLFLTYFANAYFGIAQCCQIDALRSIIEQFKDENIKNILLTVLMSAMSAAASTTTHFAQFLKVKSKSTCNNLLSKRKINIIEECKTLLKEYRKAGLCSKEGHAKSDCYNLDFAECLDSITLDEHTLVYADPPYFKEHYSRYYHVLNTLCLYDYPAMAVNPQTHENIKILMITHKVLATQQGYERLLAIIDDGIRDKQDPFLLFFMNTVEPIYEALSTSNMQLLFDTLGIRCYPITKKSEKMQWKEFEAQLKKARDGKAIDVINTIVKAKLVPVPSLVEGYYHLYFDAPDTIYGLDATIHDVLDLDYSQFRAALEFLYPEAEFSTEHGVKGEEYDNVVFVISKGWNQYQFETYAPMITGHIPIPNGKQASYERNRNLFYVCCSRPRKRLFFFVSVPIDATFRAFLVDLVGADNIYTFGQYLETKQ